MHRFLLAAALPLCLAVHPATADVVEACAQQSACTVAAVTPAGLGADGQSVMVTELRYDTAPPESWAAGFPCRNGYREFWVTTGGTESLLLELCNDGYGASGIGEDNVQVGPNRLYHSQYGGSAWRWSSDTEYQLSPPRVLRENASGFWTLGANYSDSRWDWTDYSFGDNEWWAPFCDEEGYVPDNEGEMPADAEPYHYLAIPLIDQESAPTGIESAHLGTCALTASTETGRGYIVYGDAAAAAADQAWMRVLAYEPDRLAVTVRLPQVNSGASSWLADDHIEIWQAEWMDYSTFCLDPKAGARQWAVRLVDGAVFAAHGNPSTMPQVLARESTLDSGGGALVTLHLQLAERLENYSVVLSRGDGQKKQRWLLATSELAFAKPWTFGHSFVIQPEAASCAVIDGRLDVTEWSRPVDLP